MCELLWSDPKPAPGRGPSQRGVGVGFGPDVTSNFLQDNGLDLLVRSHEVSVCIAQTLLFCTVTCRTGQGSRPPVACWGYLRREKFKESLAVLVTQVLMQCTYCKCPMQQACLQRCAA